MLDSRQSSTVAAAPAAAGQLETPHGRDDEDEILDDVLVEDVSIDGMCGVY